MVVFGVMVQIRVFNLNFMNKKKIIIISGILLFLILVFLILFFLQRTKSKESGLFNYNSEPEYLSEERKAYHGLAEDTEARVYYDDEGYEVYQIIKN